MPTVLTTVCDADVHIQPDDQTRSFIRFHGPGVHGILVNECHPRGLTLPRIFHLSIHQFDQPPPPKVIDFPDIPLTTMFLPPRAGAVLPIWRHNPAPWAAPSHAINSGPGTIWFMHRAGRRLRYE